MHGYEIHQHLAGLAGLGLVWAVKQSHLYAMLDKLEADGYIAGRQQAQDARPPRRIFHLTAAGQRAFRDWLSRPVSHGREIRLEFMAKLFFARREGPAYVSQLVARQQDECAQWRAKLQAQAEATAGAGSFEWLVFQFRIRQVTAMLDWLALCAEAGPQPGGESSQDPH
jgi:DNA-binding PadR family transcriptional regulator